MEDRLLTHAERMYEDMEQAMGQDVMREIERRLMLQAVDTNWVQHLTAMENLRQGIGLYAYGQRDPLVMYKKEGMEQFQRLQQKIQSDIAHSIFRLQVELNQSVIGGRQRNGSSRRRNGSSQRIPPRETIMGRADDGGRRAQAVGAGRKVGRNQPCPCGSGKKYKRCCGR